MDRPPKDTRPGSLAVRFNWDENIGSITGVPTSRRNLVETPHHLRRSLSSSRSMALGTLAVIIINAADPEHLFASAHQI